MRKQENDEGKKYTENRLLLSHSHSLCLIKSAQGSAQVGNATNGFPGPPGVQSVEQHQNKNKHMTTAAW